MIYCCGHTETYNKNLKDNPNLEKAIGGTVWKTYSNALDYVKTRTDGFSVFGIDADWKEDTEEEKGYKYRSLTRNARIIKL